MEMRNGFLAHSRPIVLNQTLLTVHDLSHVAIMLPSLNACVGKRVQPILQGLSRTYQSGKGADWKWRYIDKFQLSA